jgi:SpoIID/LytB domain protein
VTPELTPSRWRRRTVVLLAGLALALHGLVVGAPGAAAQSSFTFTGGGWGHGVGMSQWGARGMAANGWTWGQILTHYYSGTTVATQGTSNDLKVLVAQRTSTFTLVTGGTTTLMGVGTVPGGRTLTLTRAGDGVRVTGALNATTPGPILVSYEGAGALKVSPPGYSYAYGLLGIGPDAAGGLRAVVGDLSMQQYLYGIGEMPSSWPAEALKAQAAASRTYAQKKRNARGSKDYDLHGSVLDQAYTGTKFDAAAWRSAVDATNNRVVTHGGALIDAVYSASSGGHTENSEVVWVSSVPYLRGVPDFYDGTGGNPNGSWSRTYSGAQLGSWFGLGTVTKVQILAPLGVSGRTDKATVRLTGTGGTRDVKGASFRSTVNSRSPGSQLMSTKFTVGSSGSGSGSTVRLPTGKVHTAYANGRTVIIGGTASDPDGAPVVRVVSTMGSQRAVRETRTKDGSFLVMWDGPPGTRNVCVTVLDQPTGQGVSLGCRDVVVK